MSNFGLTNLRHMAAYGAYGVIAPQGPFHSPYTQESGLPESTRAEMYREQEAERRRLAEEQQRLIAEEKHRAAEEQRRFVEEQQRRLAEEQELAQMHREHEEKWLRKQKERWLQQEQEQQKAETQKPKAKAKPKTSKAQQAEVQELVALEPTPTTVTAELDSTVTITEPTIEGDTHMATTTDTKNAVPATDSKASTIMDWTKRAFAAGAEGAKDGAALVAAETLTSGVIAALSVEAPILLTIYNNSALAQKLMQVLVPYCLGLAATMGWLPQSELVAALCERALRAAVSGNIGPLFARFKVPVMRVVESAMRDTADADRFNNATRVV